MTREEQEKLMETASERFDERLKKWQNDVEIFELMHRQHPVLSKAGNQSRGDNE